MVGSPLRRPTVKEVSHRKEDSEELQLVALHASRDEKIERLTRGGTSSYAERTKLSQNADI
jgi:hypothetical protein